MKRRAFGMLAALCLGLASSVALAQPYPNKPIRLMLGFPPGSATDFIARLLAPKMSEGLGQPVLVENRPGASGIVAAAAGAKAPPDGYTILVTVPGSITTARALHKDRLQYSPETDFEPIGLIGVSPLLLVVKADSPVKTAADFVALTRSTPGGLNVASYGVGSPSHFAVEMLRVQSKLAITHVPHNGSGALQTALLGDVVPAAVDSVTAGMPLIAAGRVRPLAITASSRVPALPDVPTMAEAGLGSVELGGWAGLHAPKGTPVEIVNRLNAEMNRVLALPEIRQQMSDRLVLVGGPPSVFETHIRNETARLTKLIQDAGLSFD
jgi:tripartite-type tricarboxylate transporter receptor subunit TctC